MEKIHKLITTSIKKEPIAGDIIKTKENTYFLWNEWFTTSGAKFNVQQLLIISKDKVKVGDTYFVNLYDVESNKFDAIEVVDTIEDIWINNSSVDKTRHIENCHKIIAAYPKINNVPTITTEFLCQWLHEPVNEVSVIYNDVCRVESSFNYDNDVIIVNGNGIATIDKDEKYDLSKHEGLWLDGDKIFCFIPQRGITIKSIDTDDVYLTEAKKLVERFKHYAHSNPSLENELFHRRLTENAKGCANIAVDEILKNIDATILYHKESKALPLNKEYWLNVREAINLI